MLSNIINNHRGQSEFDFGLDQGVHLMHVAGDPHHPHLYRNQHDRNQRDST